MLPTWKIGSANSDCDLYLVSYPGHIRAMIRSCILNDLPRGKSYRWYFPVVWTEWRRSFGPKHEL
ncbi:hypothetical protein MTBSS4_420008 [Magnetospirillum sp. SS-4]|nr:hypothetical protein MTBSS4_420008 [Magnetospirillum sp. SS-4]